MFIEIVEGWLEAFEAAVSTAPEKLQTLFHRESYWRDLLAFTWRIDTIEGGAEIASELAIHAGRAKAGHFCLAAKQTPPSEVLRAGTTAVEAFFDFETADGRGSGVLRLTEDGGAWKAWTLLTTLESLTADDGKPKDSQPYSRDFRGPNWLDRRTEARQYTDRDPAVLVVGGGHAGLSTAARLAHMGVDTLIVDREERIGDNWRKRYHALVLHNQVHVNHLPYMPFPPTWPPYIPKDKLASWFESYVESLELNFWTRTEFEGGRYDDERKRWSVTLRRGDGSRRVMHPRHIVVATGVSGIPSVPQLPGLDTFEGQVLHSSQYVEGDAWKGRKALVIGTGNSGHDIAQDLHASGVDVTLVQRSPTLIVNVEPSAQLPYALYGEDRSVEECDLITAATPLALGKKTHVALTAHAKKLDKPLLDGLEKRGFRLDDGEDGTGWQFKYLTRGGGYYFNVGCSDLIVKGEVGLVQFADIERFTAQGAEMRDGSTLAADVVVLATGYKGQEVLVARLFGDDVAAKVGPIWGFGGGQELRNMFTRTPQPGLWFIAGSLAQCRIYSKYLGLQISAVEKGMTPPSP